MNRNRSILGVIGVVAAAVVIYFGFFYPAPNGDDLQGAIGTVSKHQNEQITNEDVVLAGEESSDWSDDPVVVEAMATIVEKATVAQRSFAFLAVGRQERANLLQGATAKTRSAVLEKVSRDEQVAAFERLEKAEQKAMLARMNIKREDFGAMSLEKKIAAFGTLGAKERADILGRVSIEAQMGAVSRANPAVHSEILGRASRHELARVFMAAPALSRVEMVSALPLNQRQELMGKVWIESSSSMLQRATPMEVENLRNEMSVENAAALFGASSVHDQLAWTGRAVKSSPTGFEFGRVQKLDAFGRLFLQATPAQKVAFFRAQPAEVQNDLFGKMSIKREAWGDLDLNAKAMHLARLSVDNHAAILARVDKSVVIDLARHAEPSIQKEFLGGLSRTERANALKFGASSREVQLALGRHPEIRKEVFGQVSMESQLAFMGRMVRTESPIR